jgi:hypothetical protein
MSDPYSLSTLNADAAAPHLASSFIVKLEAFLTLQHAVNDYLYHNPDIAAVVEKIPTPVLEVMYVAGMVEK